MVSIFAILIWAAGWYQVGQRNKTLPHRPDVACFGSNLTLRFPAGHVDPDFVERFHRALQGNAKCQVAIQVISPPYEHETK